MEIDITFHVTMIDLNKYNTYTIMLHTSIKKESSSWKINKKYVQDVV